MTIPVYWHPELFVALSIFLIFLIVKTIIETIL
jgi:hypothetical protein